MTDRNLTPEEELQKPQQQAESEPEASGEEPPHPGWQPLTRVFQSADPFFDRINFLLSYEYSSNVYLIKGDYLSIVDPGNDYTVYMDLFRQGFKPDMIKKIALTHGHRDHAMGALELLGAYPSIRESGGFELILHQDGPQELKRAAQQFGCKVTELRGGETVELSGLEWEAIYTPGHTLDGLSYYHAPSKTIITGDTVLPLSFSEPDENAGGRLDHYLISLRYLLRRDIENILPGHSIPAKGLGRPLIEKTYVTVMLKLIGVEGEISWIEGATRLAQKGLLDEAIFCCDRELTLHPDNQQALELKSLSLTELGQLSEALPVLDEILARQHDNVHALTAKGTALLELGKYQECIEYFDRVLTINPKFEDAQMYKGMALYLAGNYDAAMEIPVFRKEFTRRMKGEQLKKMRPEKEPETQPGD